MKIKKQLEKKYACYHLLQRYYQGEWEAGAAAAETLAEYLGQEAQLRLEKANFAAIEPRDVEYDYNRLFVGPGKLYAPPYASAYLNRDGLLMQEETRAVRALYAQAGLAVREKNAVPDDALWLELECACYLLRERAFSRAPERFAALYRRLVGEHLCLWVPRHTADVQRHARTEICRAAARWTERFFTAEYKQIKEGRE